MSLVDLGKRLLELAKLGETEEVRQLMTNGAPFTTDWLGASPLHMAAQYGHVDTAEVLLRAGISRDARTKVDRTPLHIASQEGHLPLVELLLRHGADVESRDMLHMTSLHWAVERGHPAVIRCLLRHGADVSAASKFAKMPIDIAMDNCREDLVHLLQDVESIAEKKPAPKPVRLNVASTNSTTSTPIVLKAVPHKANVYTPSIVTSAEIIKKPTTPTAKVGKPIVLQRLEKSANNNNNAVVHDSDDGESDSCSTSVLATLAALAEATAPNSAVSNTDALQWLETHGITMLPADNSTIVSSALEGGQTITLTEAGKLALNWVREGTDQNNSNKVVDATGEIPKVITIVADQSQLPSIIGNSQGGIVVVSGSTLKDASKQLKNTAAVADKGTLEESELKRKLEEVTRQAEEYKAQLQKTMNEAQEYKKQLEKMRHEPPK